MAKCTDCGKEIELVEMMEALVAMEEQRGRSLGLLCPECRPPEPWSGQVN
jgi:DNA-directed RNA polymerase subunit RPC12/RpoP